MNAAQFSSALGKVNDRYIMEAITYERRKKSGWLKWGAVAACFGLIFTVAMTTLPGILRGQGNIEPPPNPNVPDPVVSDDNQPSVEPLQPPSEQKITINWDNVAVNESIGLAPDGARRYYDPALYDEESWGTEEVRAYYGWELAPAYIPDGLTGGGNAVAGHIVQEKATGEIVQEQSGRSFWTAFWEDGSAKSDDDIYIPTGFTITASKISILHCALLPVDDSKTTSFGGVPVTLSHCSLPYGPFDPTQKAPDGLHNMPAGYYDIYVASFTLNGVEYEIQAQRLELEEVIKIAASIINVPYSENFTVGNSQNLPDKGNVPAEPSFADVPADHWAYEAIEDMAEQGVVNGVSPGIFSPDNQIACTDFCTMVSRLLFSEELKEHTDTAYWWQPYADTLLEVGALDNTTAKAFYIRAMYNWDKAIMEAPMNRYDMAQIMYNALAAKGFSMPTSRDLDAARSAIADYMDIPPDYADAVAAMYALGCLNGMDPAGNFRGDEKMDRAQACAVLMRLQNKLDARTEKRPAPSAEPTPEPVPDGGNQR